MKTRMALAATVTAICSFTVGTAQAAPVGPAGSPVRAGWPERCSYGAMDTEGDGGSAICRSGRGQYQVVINCKNIITGDGDFYYGKWVGIGVLSLRFRPANTFREFVGINMKAG